MLCLLSLCQKVNSDVEGSVKLQGQAFTLQLVLFRFDQLKPWENIFLATVSFSHTNAH
jgi:hypothetical protein